MKTLKKMNAWFNIKFSWIFAPPSKQGKEHRYKQIMEKAKQNEKL